MGVEPRFIKLGDGKRSRVAYRIRDILDYEERHERANTTSAETVLT